MLPIARWSLRLPRPHIRALLPRHAATPKLRTSVHHPQATAPFSSSRRLYSEKSDKPNGPSESKPNEPSKVEAVSNALATTPDAENNLITPVYMPEDPNAVLKQTHPAMRLLDNSAIVVQRQVEMMNVLMGFEQANRYVIMDPHGNHIGYLAERDHGLGNAVARQMFKTHRSFTTHVFDRDEKEILRFHRPFSWINSKIRVYDAVGQHGGTYTSSPELQGTSPGSMINQTSASVSGLPMSDMRVIGSAEQEWAPLRRKYNLFLARHLENAAEGTPQLTSGDLPISSSKGMIVAEDDAREIGMLQFARVDEPFLSWDFSLVSEDGRLIGSVNRNFGGFAREIFTDTGVYALRMDAAGLAVGSQTGEQPSSISEQHPGMTLDQRAVMLATAVSVDFDYFSRHSGSGGLFPMWPIWMPWGGAAGEAAGGAAAGEAAGAGAVGAASETGIASEVGAAARGAGSAEGWAAGAGTMAGYEAMKGARGGGQEVDSQSPQVQDPYSPEQQAGNQQNEEVWGQNPDPWAEKDNDNDPWGGDKGGSDGGTSGGGGGGSEGGGFDFSDWF
ncbi:Scramblase-domain-containing protein [Massarina eburnea CBS 473.64]|uniref:Scramblase-domain-containing protein n=1 Tax=Massarina eburnea CBS 473.64 TaxID=1395130 RepID=A0A6A6SIZ0_9PLEO|nr:Scramblase-domain-containing protein [Massarina eburnea CBS 473.64]